jgi:hypothetical protein
MAAAPVGSLVIFTTTGTNAIADLNNNLALIRNVVNALVTSSNTLISGLTIPAPTISSPTLTGTITVTGATFTGLTAASVGPGTFPAGVFSVPTLTVTGTLTLTGATITGAPTWGSNQPITLSTAAQPNVTSLGTLTALTVSGVTSFTGHTTIAQFNAGNSGAAITLNFATNGNNQRVTLNSATPTITLSGGVAGGVYTVEVVQDGSGSRVPTWAGASGATVIWPGGVTPTLTTTASRADLFSFIFDAVPATPHYVGTTVGLNYTV